MSADVLCSEANEQEDDASFVYVRIKQMANDKTSSKYLLSCMLVAYARVVSISRLFLDILTSCYFH